MPCPDARVAVHRPVRMVATRPLRPEKPGRRRSEHRVRSILGRSGSTKLRAVAHSGGLHCVKRAVPGGPCSAGLSSRAFIHRSGLCRPAGGRAHVPCAWGVSRVRRMPEFAQGESSARVLRRGDFPWLPDRSCVRRPVGQAGVKAALASPDPPTDGGPPRLVLRGGPPAAVATCAVGGAPRGAFARTVRRGVRQKRRPIRIRPFVSRHPLVSLRAVRSARAGAPATRVPRARWPGTAGRGAPPGPVRPGPLRGAWRRRAARSRCGHAGGGG